MKKYFKIILQILLTSVFLLAGFAKVSTQPMLVESFTNFNMSLAFMYFIGVCELLGALWIAFSSKIDKRLPIIATACLWFLMLGAIGSHVLAWDPFSASIPAIVLSILLCVYGYMLKNTMK